MGSLATSLNNHGRCFGTGVTGWSPAAATVLAPDGPTPGALPVSPEKLAEAPPEQVITPYNGFTIYVSKVPVF